MRTIELKDKVVKYELYSYYTHIYDSYKIWCIKDMCYIIDKIREQAKEMGKSTPLNDRCKFSLVVEWYAHNIAYALHFMRSRTKDVDF